MSAGPPEPTPAERRLDEHLELLRSDQTGLGHSLAARTIRTARWQRAVRGPLRVAGMIAAAVLDGLGLVGRGGRRG